MNILVICAGNTCRSPMAGGLLRLISAEEEIGLEIRSAGVAHHPNERVATNAVVVMQELGVDISEEYSKRVTPEALEWADIVLAVEHRHATYLLENHPSIESKICWLDECVRDPFCGPVETYRQVRDELRALVSGFLQTISTE